MGSDLRPTGPNPFALPEPTGARFLLVVAAALTATVILAEGAVLQVPGLDQPYRRAAGVCRHAAQAAVPVSAAPVSSLPLGAVGLELGQLAVYNRCLDPWRRLVATAGMGALLTVLLGTLAAWWGYPGWAVARRRLRPLPVDRIPGLSHRLSSLCRGVGLERVPEFLWDPRRWRVRGQVLGRPGRDQVVLSAGLVACFLRDPPLFDAVVRHELAHLRNRDLGWTFLAMSAWRSFLVLLLVPVAALELGQPLLGHLRGSELAAWWRSLPGLALRAGAMALLVRSVRDSALRSRELHADLRAFTADPAGWWRVLDLLPADPATPLGAVFAPRPSRARRREVVRHIASVFEVGAGEALLTGLAGGIVLVGAELTLGFAGVAWHQAAAAFLTAGLVMGAVGLGLWRSTWAATLLGRPARPPWGVALGLGCGLVIGPQLSFATQTSAATRYLQLGLSWSGVAYDAALAGTTALVVLWTAGVAREWLRAVWDLPVRRAAYLAGLLVPWVVLAVLLAQFGILGDVAALSGAGLADLGARAWPGSSTPALGLLLVVTSLAAEPLTLVALLCLWVFPLVAALGARRPPAHAWPGGLLEGMDGGRPEAEGSLALRWAVLAGLAAGGAFWTQALWLAPIVLLVPQLAQSSSMADAVAVASLLVVQPVAAVVAAARAPRLASAQGLLAAFLAGTVAAGPFALVLRRPELLAAALGAGGLVAAPCAALAAACRRRPSPASLRTG
jgi:hypothetical protein